MERYPCLLTGRLNTVKKTNPLKLIYRFNEILITITAGFFTDLNWADPKIYMATQRIQEKPKQSWKRTKSKDLYFQFQKLTTMLQ